MLESRPVWGAWIEILVIHSLAGVIGSRPVWGAWIEIYIRLTPELKAKSRAPYGARGLKCLELGLDHRAVVVAPRMGRVD